MADQNVPGSVSAGAAFPGNIAMPRAMRLALVAREQVGGGASA